MGRIFQFESMWLKDPRCEVIVEEAWDEALYGGSGDVLNRCLESCHARFKMWNGVDLVMWGKQWLNYRKS